MKKNKVMIRIIFLFVSMLIISLISAVISSWPYYYSIQLDYNNKTDNKLSIKSVSIEFHYEMPLNFNSEDSNYLEIIDNKNNVLYKENFSVPNFVIYDLGDENGTFIESKFVELENVSFNVYLPYYENSYQLVVYDNSKGKRNEMDRILLSQFSKTGFDKSDFRISKDLEIKDEYISEAGEIYRKELGKKADKDYKNYVVILLIILIILLIILIYSLKKKEKL